MSQDPQLEREVREVHRTILRHILEYKARVEQEWGVEASLLEPFRILCEDLIENPNELVEIIRGLPSSQSYYS